MAYLFRTRNKSGKFHPRWRFQYTDWQGRRRTATGKTSKSETEKLAARVEAKNDEIRKGFRPVPKKSDKHVERPFQEVMSEYFAWGESQGGRGGRAWSKGHTRMTRSLLSWWKDHLGLKTLADLCCVLPRVEEALRGLQNEGRTGKTLQNYSQALNGFCRWSLARGYMDEDPLKDLSRFVNGGREVRRC